MHDAVTCELPETVVVFGGSAKTYHRESRLAGGPDARCGAAGRNPIRKYRDLIESHYSPCKRCFSRGELAELTPDSDRSEPL